MSVIKITQAWKTKCDTHTQKLLLIALADNASDEGFCWPSTHTLSEKCNLSRQSVSKNLQQLEELKLIRICPTNGTSNRYWVLQDKEEAALFANDCAPSIRVGRVSTTLTGGVNHVDRGVSTTLTGGVNHVDTNHNRTVIKPSKNHQEIPVALNTEEFLKAWTDWTTDRKHRKKPISPLAAERQLKKLAEWGAEKAIRAIDNAIAAGWQGLFEPKENGDQQPSKTEYRRGYAPHVWEGT
jgi:DNA-binding MarR family transcriptional regulator